MYDTRISIGPDQWIAHGNFERDPKIEQIDRELAPVLPFIASLETDCVAECCGINAFGLWPEQIKDAIKEDDSHRVEGLILAFLQIEEAVNAMDCDVVCSKRMNACFRVGAFLQLVRHLRSVLEDLHKSPHA